jgi:hypothetical protein
MIKKHSKVILIALVCIVFIFIGLQTNKKRSEKKLKIETFISHNGWGYNIKFKNKILIHQEYIPAIAGHYTFKSEIEAKKVAYLVINKMERKKLPTICRQELDSLGISYFSD